MDIIMVLAMFSAATSNATAAVPPKIIWLLATLACISSRIWVIEEVSYPKS